ncbi:MAG: PP2C family protein-serine/threonine phosphatase [Syntrophotaleaceae bacterium]
MPEKILLAQQETETSCLLYNFLRDEGYLVLKAANLPDTGRLLQELPDLLLLDTDLALQNSPQDWSELSHNVQRNKVSCLLFSSGRRQPAGIAPLAPWADDMILEPVDRREVLFKIASQLTIRRLTYEAEMANRALLEKQKELEAYQRSAADIQKSLLPGDIPDLPNLHFAWRFLPCEKVGGDLFNIMRVADDTVMTYLLDVSGHGISSAMVTVAVYQSLSPFFGRIIKQPIADPPYFRLLSPGEVLQQLEKEYPYDRFGKIFTISYALINTRTGMVRYSNAGHPSPLLTRRNGSSEILGAGGSIIGTGCSGPFETGNILLQPGDRLYLYSDGIIEHSDGKGNQFGQKRLYRKLESLRKLSVEACCDKVIESLCDFGQGAPIRDDVTMLGIEFLGEDDLRTN